MCWGKKRCTNATLTASIICVDLVVRQLPGKKNFKIEESNSFLSTGLSLSFGVMVCGFPFVIFYFLPMRESADGYLISDFLVTVQHVAVCQELPDQRRHEPQDCDSDPDWEFLGRRFGDCGRVADFASVYSAFGCGL